MSVSEKKIRMVAADRRNSSIVKGHEPTVFVGAGYASAYSSGVSNVMVSQMACACRIAMSALLNSGVRF
jgi:hypothetical protein